MPNNKNHDRANERSPSVPMPSPGEIVEQRLETSESRDDSGIDRSISPRAGRMPSGANFDSLTRRRQRRGKFWETVFRLSTVIGIIALLALLYNILNQSFGLVAIVDEVPEEQLAVNGVPLAELPSEQLIAILEDNVSAGLMRRFESEQPLPERSRGEIYDLVVERVINPTIEETWHLDESLMNRSAIEREVDEKFEGARLEFRSWINLNFITSKQSSNPIAAGVRSAILGSLWTIVITILFSFPVGVGAAIYLEEYANHENRINRMIQTNINNLAGVPSIIYGMLGLAIFVRVMAPLTSGAMFGVGDGATANGRTILSAGLTLGLLILPLIIINGQEAIRAVPNSLRQAGYGLGATQWQVIWHHVLPSAIPGILTGTILAVSRAIGETAPIIVVGAATFLASDPSGPFSRFTTLPIQIYQWTARPQAEFRNLAAAAIVVLLILLLSLNALAVILRNRFSENRL